MRDKTFLFGKEPPCNKEVWPLLKKAPRTGVQSDRSYDTRRKEWAQYLGLDMIFTPREYYQSVQTDSQGRKVLVNSYRNGKISGVKLLPPEHYAKENSGKIKFPRSYLGIPHIQKRVEKLSYAVHVVAQSGIVSKRNLKDLKRLSLTWWQTKYNDMRKLVNRVTCEITRSFAFVRKPRKSYDKSYTPRFRGRISHENGVETPLWSWVQK